MLNPRERLKRLHEQKLELPKYDLVPIDGIWYAFFAEDNFLYWEEMCPEAFEDFEQDRCGNGCCVQIKLGRMQ